MAQRRDCSVRWKIDDDMRIRQNRRARDAWCVGMLATRRNGPPTCQDAGWPRIKNSETLRLERRVMESLFERKGSQAQDGQSPRGE